MEINRPKRRAHQKFRTLNPSTSLSINIIIQAFITQINSPKVRMVSGKVRKTMSGFIKIFTKPSRIATPNAVK